ncbi:MAG: bifunctional DNA primase/polymerase [Planctomycetota bacterium]
MIPKSDDRVDLALAYAAKGWKVYPIQPPNTDGSCSCRKGESCPDPGKHPFHALGGLKSASTDPMELRDLFATSDASIGLLCDGFWVLDCDGDEGIADVEALIAGNGAIPRTPTSDTGGGGRHYYFQADKRIAKNRTKIRGKSIDIRTKGGAVVAPPSLHVSGKVYRWTTPPDVPLAAAPEWLIDFVSQEKQSSEGSGSFVFEDLDLATAPGVGEGSRNDQLCRLVGSHLARLGDSPDLLTLATEWGRRCTPPIDSRIVEKTVANLVAKHLANNSYKFNVEGEEQGAEEADAAIDLHVRSFRSIEAKPVEWLWEGRLALGKITLLTGDGGVGKSMLTCDLAARISQGSDLPGGGVAPIGDTFFIGSEDGAEDTVRPRLDAAGADVDRVHLIQGPKPKGEEIAGPIDLSRHVHKLDRLLSQHPEARLLIVDPIMDYLGPETNSDKATDVRRVLSPLRSLAEKHHVAIIAMNHLNKAGRGPKSRSLGSGAFVQVARIELRVVEDPDNPNRRLLLPVKNNLAAAPGLAYRIESGSNGAGFAIWEEGTVDISIGEVEADGAGQDRSAINEAIEWLEGFLSDGPVKASEAFAHARKYGIAEATLKRAKKRLRVSSIQRDRSHWWQLPEGEKGVEEAIVEGEDRSPNEGEEGDTTFVF